MEDQAHDAEQSQQARRRPQDALDRPVPRCGKTQMNADFLERHLDAPAAGVEVDDLFGRHGRIGAVEVFVPVRSLDVVDEDPTHRNQAAAGFVPLSLAPDQFDSPGLAAVPVDGFPSCAGVVRISGAKLRISQVCWRSADRAITPGRISRPVHRSFAASNWSAVIFYPTREPNLRRELLQMAVFGSISDKFCWTDSLRW